MKIKLFIWLAFFIICNCAMYAKDKPFASNDIFQTHYFIENHGQFNKLLHRDKPIDFAVIHANDEIYFNSTGLNYHIVKATLEKKSKKRKHNEIEEEEDDEDEKNKYDIEEDWFELEWLGVNKQADIQKTEKSSHYFTYGTADYNSYGFKTITYKNIYPGIDITYELHINGGIEYSLILKPNADINNIKFKYSSQKGVKVGINNKRLIIENKVGKLIESNIKAFYPNGQEVKLHYEIDKNNIVLFKSEENINTNLGLIIDPWITAVTSLSGNPTCDNMAYDVDYDLMGNLVVIGGGGSFGVANSNLPKLAKYDILGNLLWTFSGNIVSTSWSSSPIQSTGVTGSVGNFTIDKLTNKIYMSQGFNLGAGATVVRLDPNGNYDNFTSIPNNQLQEIWEMKFDCNNGKLMGMGGSTNSNLNFGVIDTISGTVVNTNFTGLAILRQDVVSATLDNNGEIYTILANSYPPQTVNNKIFKLDATNTSSLWSAFSGFNDFVEADNKTFSGVPYFSNGYNAVHANANFLFYYDGLHLKTFDKSSGAAVGTPFTIPSYISKMQGGIFANDCNEVYIGGNNGNVLQYIFNGSTFTLQNTLFINGFLGKSVLDIVYNPLNNLLYVCGNGFVATLDPQSTCPTNSSNGNIQLGYTITCPDSAVVNVLNPVFGTSYSFIWVDSTSNTTLLNSTLPVGVNSQGLSGLTPGHTIHVSVLKSSACQVLSNDTSFVIACNTSTINIQKCPGDTIMLSNNTIISVPGTYTDTLLNVLNQDSIITIIFSNFLTYSTTNNQSICQGQTFTLPNNTIVNSGGTYVNLFNTVNGCDSIITTILTVNPTYNLVVNDSICSNQTYTLPNSTIVNTSGTYINSFSTSNLCDSIITTNLFVKPIQSIVINDSICSGNNYTMPDNSIASTTGTYTFNFINQYNCDSIITVNLIVLPPQIKNELITLCDQSSYLLPNGNTVSSNGIYLSQLVTTKGCDSSIYSQVEFNTTKFSNIDYAICENKSYTLPDNSTVNTAGIYVDTLQASNGCDSIITTNLRVVALPRVDLGNDTVLCGNSSINLDVTNSNPNATYHWYDNTVLPTKTIFEKGTFYVEVTIQPCEPVRDSIHILDCTCEIFIPSAFSPNGDINNDIFKPIIPCKIDQENYLFLIYNKWGQQIFNTTLPEDGWDGTFFNVNQNIGTYMYLLKFTNLETGKTEVYKGDVTLIR